MLMKVFVKFKNLTLSSYFLDLKFQLNNKMFVDEKTVEVLGDVAHRLRIHSIEATSASNSGYLFKY